MANNNPTGINQYSKGGGSTKTKASKLGNRISGNLGGPTNLHIPSKMTKTKAGRANLAATIRRNLTPGGYAQAIYEARTRARRGR